MNKPQFSRMTAFDYIRDHGIKNAKANLTPYNSGDLVFIVPKDELPALKRIVESLEMISEADGYAAFLSQYKQAKKSWSNDKRGHDQNLGRMLQALEDYERVHDIAS